MFDIFCQNSKSYSNYDEVGKTKVRNNVCVTKMYDANFEIIIFPASTPCALYFGLNFAIDYLARLM